MRLATCEPRGLRPARSPPAGPDAPTAVSRTAQLDLLSGLGPDGVAREAAKLAAAAAPAPAQAPLPHLMMPDHHDVRAHDVVTRRLHGALAAAAEQGPKDFSDLLLVPGIGARTVRTWAMVAEVVHGAPCRFSDPARCSRALGGKDRHPFPVPTKVYDETIRVLKTAVENARLGREEALGAIQRLDDQARRLEGRVEGPSLDGYIAHERAMSHAYGGRSVFGWEEAPSKTAATKAV